MWELYVEGQYVECYNSKWEAVSVGNNLPEGVEWHIEHFSGT